MLWRLKKKICVLISPKSTYSVWYSVQISTPSWSLDMFTFHDSSNSVQIELTQTYSSFASLFSELGAFGPNTLASWCKELTHWKRPWCWERLRAGGEGEDRGWDGWMHHRLNGHEFEWTLADSEGQGSLACCRWWGRKESDTTEPLNNKIKIHTW